MNCTNFEAKIINIFVFEKSVFNKWNINTENYYEIKFDGNYKIKVIFDIIVMYDKTDFKLWK